MYIDVKPPANLFTDEGCIFAISIPLAGLALSTVCRLILGTDTVETSVRLYGFSMGLVILCLTQFFARGVELEQDVEGLV